MSISDDHYSQHHFLKIKSNCGINCIALNHKISINAQDCTSFNGITQAFFYFIQVSDCNVMRWLVQISCCIWYGEEHRQVDTPTYNCRHLRRSHRLEVKREGNQNCLVLCSVRQLSTMIHTQMWSVLTVLWTRFCNTGPISLCVDWCLYFVCFCFILYSCCCIIVSTVGWTWWYWSVVFRNKLPSVLWHCWLGRLIRKNSSPIWPIMCLVKR